MPYTTPCACSSPAGNALHRQREAPACCAEVGRPRLPADCTACVAETVHTFRPAPLVAVQALLPPTNDSMPSKPNPSCGVERWMKYHYGPGCKQFAYDKQVLAPGWPAALQLPALRRAFPPQGAHKQPGAALAAKAAVPQVTRDLLHQQPQHYMGPLLRRIASLLNPNLLQWVGDRVGQMQPADVFNHARRLRWSLQHPHTSTAGTFTVSSCMPYHWPALRRRLSPDASNQQREEHHFARADRQGAYLKVQLGVDVTEYAHRLLCALYHGPPPQGTEVSHICGNTACLNPHHMRWATHKHNAADATALQDKRQQAKAWCRHGAAP